MKMHAINLNGMKCAIGMGEQRQQQQIAATLAPRLVHFTMSIASDYLLLSTFSLATSLFSRALEEILSGKMLADKPLIILYE